jgi:carboxyl-terminal processing protease
MDLRQNGGGHLSEAIELSGLFIDSGPVVQVRETTGQLEKHDDPSDGAVYDGPLAVLVDRYSASASEIFAAAIQDYERGVIIGQQTFGKGTVQNLFDLDRSIRSDEAGNGQLTLTIGKYYRVTGDSTQNRGVFPDIELPSAIPTEAVGENTRPTALAWDVIEPARFRPEMSLDAEINELNASHLSRSVTDANYNFLIEDATARTRGWNENTVSLSIEKRRAQQEQEEQDALARENARRTALGLPALSTIDELQDLENPVSAAGILLDEATRTVAEIAARQRGQSSPASRTSAAGANPSSPDGV